MQEGQFSRTALGAAGHRAAHQALEGGFFFADPLALPILGADAQAAIDKAKAQPLRRGLRLFIALRSRFAEDSAHAAIARGVRQVVVLGAGFDTFAYRLEAPAALRVFEVDHPATQAEKRRRLEAARVAEPAHVVYVGCDFEREIFVDALAAAGFDRRQPSFVFWLGVTAYLTHEAVYAALAAVAALPGGEEIVFDYAASPETIDDQAARTAHEDLARKVAAAGEPLRAYFDPPALHAQLTALGFSEIEDLRAEEVAARYAPGRAPTRRGAGARMLRAATAPTA
ncbi:MAG: class I SAM-dependent methyltransferase [Roseiarcus sp.]|uniref:class I SAM-dependent methyltransferase n=1 Tax=Roseiarcus sp. TaxID=1969460 RepID=UPI003C262E9C